MWNKIQRIYIGTDLVRPKWEYSYTFKWKTSTQIWNDRTVKAGTIATTSNWVTGTSSKDLTIRKSIQSLANAKKIIFSYTVVVTNSRYSATHNGLVGSIWGATFNLQWSNFTWVYVTMIDGTGHNGNVVWTVTTWTYKPIMTIDLENKSIVWTLSWYSDSTLTLTDSQVDVIRQFNELTVYISLNFSAVSDISILVEY